MEVGTDIQPIAFSQLHLMWAVYYLRIYIFKNIYEIGLIISVKKTDLILVIYW